MLLKFRFKRRLYLLDSADGLLDLAAVAAIEQRHQRAGAGGVADGLYLVEVAVRDQAQHHRVFRVDEGAEGAGEADGVDVDRQWVEVSTGQDCDPEATMGPRIQVVLIVARLDVYSYRDFRDFALFDTDADRHGKG